MNIVLNWFGLERELFVEENEWNNLLCSSLSSMSFWKWWFMTNSNSNHSDITWWWMWFEKHQFNQIQNNEGDFISMRINQFFYWGCVKTTVKRIERESHEKNKNKENVFLFLEGKEMWKEKDMGEFPFC